MISDGTLVYYHGVLASENGFYTAYPLGNGLYQLESVNNDRLLAESVYHGVAEKYFTVVPVPEIPEPVLEPGLYKSPHNTLSGKVDRYVLTPDGRWFWFDTENSTLAECLTEPIYKLSELIPWTTE